MSCAAALVNARPRGVALKYLASGETSAWAVRLADPVRRLVHHA